MRELKGDWRDLFNGFMLALDLRKMFLGFVGILFSLGAVLGRGRPMGQRCLMGSVKTNVGHLEGASGVTGFIKGVLTAQHGMAPPNLHFHEPNPGIDWENDNLVVPTQPTPLECSGRPWIVGVNSFGAGGTNAHVVLQQPAAARSGTQETPTSPNGQPAAGAPPAAAP